MQDVNKTEIIENDNSCFFCDHCKIDLINEKAECKKRKWEIIVFSILYAKTEIEKIKRCKEFKLDTNGFESVSKSCENRFRKERSRQERR